LGVLEVMCLTAIAVPLASLARWAAASGRLEGELECIGVTMAAVVFVGLLMGYCLGLLQDGDEMGRDLTVLLFWVVWLSDAAAYTAGSLWGRRKLLPAVSPGKTVEGMLAALVIAIVAALVAKFWFFHRLGMTDALALGLLLGCSGVLGDLCESLLKRAASVKDSGWLFPGHGGMLDRTDSLLFAAPVLFYYHKCFLG
ncbi:MAG TPA: phosphatidate cytidylyltransferase, partial [Candidatus Polarisedimenticolia bacterium]|nr:phosphatidate cytidylyltransferase [Candidatus Polarisedimenticolia bacterium]